MAPAPLALLALPLLLAAPRTSDLRTVAERSAFQRTGRYDEVERLCAAFPAAYPGRVSCTVIGGTGEGRPMLALAASADGALTPEEARRRARPVVFIEGGLHAGEIDGKDAGFLLLRELLDGKTAPGLLGQVTLVFLPVLNPDGHERFGRNQRPNQLGPEEGGWRTTATNLNLNRDFAKVETPEVAALLGALDRWDPLVFVDVHVTDGADFQPELAYLVEPIVGEERLVAAGRALREGVATRMERRRHRIITGFYPELVEHDLPSSGFEAYAGIPRLGASYWGCRGRLGVLIEMHSWKTYPVRVRVAHDALLDTLLETAARGATWRQTVTAVEADDARLGGTEIALDWERTGESRMIDFPGYAWERRLSEVSGTLYTTYDRRRPAIWRIPLFEKLRPSITARVPRGGYLVPPAHAAWVAAKLEHHGISFRVLDAPRKGLAVESWRATETTFRAKPYEGRQLVTAKGAWAAERRDVPAGSLFVPAAQPRARLLVHLLDPAGPDSLLAWGYFNAHLEQKEYLEPYVAEQVAREMLKDPAVRAAFTEALAKSPELAKDPEARLDWFYRRSPAWDTRYGLYPIVRSDETP